jgi:putative transposase
VVFKLSQACVEHVAAKLDVSERFACKVLDQHRSMQRKVPRTADDEAALPADIIALAKQYGRYGYHRILLPYCSLSARARIRCARP